MSHHQGQMERTGFRDLPANLRWFILAHLPPLGLLAWLVGTSPLPQTFHPLTTTLLLGFALWFGLGRVDLGIFEGKITLTSAVVCLAMLSQGPHVAVACAAVGSAATTLTAPGEGPWKLTFRPVEWYLLLFNLANCVISVSAGVLNFDWIRSHSPGETGLVLGVMGFSACYILTNCIGVALAVSLRNGLPVVGVFKKEFLWALPGSFACASVAIAIDGLYRHLGYWSLFFLPPVWLINHTYRMHDASRRLTIQKVQQNMEHVAELTRLNSAVIASLATAIDAKDRYTCSHISRVQHYASCLARSAGVSGPEYEAVVTGALVHDIGKLGVPDHILAKPGRLTMEEFRKMKTHVEIGVAILAPIPFPFPVVDVVRSHHERWDGLGYPDGKREDEIPVGARIISIVDVFDALTSNRPYRRAMTHDEAIKTLLEGAGRQFDPRLVQLFVEILPEVQKQLADIEDAKVAAGTNQVVTPTGLSALAETSRSALEMAAMCGVAHALADQETVAGICNVVAEQARQLSPADTAVLFLQRNGSPELTAVAAIGFAADRLLGMTISPGEGVTGWVAETGQSRLNNSAAPDVARRFRPEENMELAAATSVPLMLAGNGTAVLTVYSRSYTVFTQDHLRNLSILTEHASAALVNVIRMERHQEMAYTDPVTGLANSRALVRHLDRLLYPGETSDGGRPPFSLLMIDLDNFKCVNDRFGHLRGDQVLAEVAHRLMNACRPGDIVCRYAGDEFVIILPNTARIAADRISRRIRQVVASITPLENELKIEGSIGVASFPDDGTNGRDLLSQADLRMYEDKFSRRRAHVEREEQLLGSPPLFAGSGSSV